MELSLYWSSLPGVPKHMKWPIQVVEWTERPLVYCHADDAYFNVHSEQLIPFPGPEKFQDLGIDALKKKPDLLKAFKKDMEWATRENCQGPKRKKRKRRKKEGNTCESALAPVSIPVSIDNIDTSTSAHDEEAGSSLAPDIHDSALAPDNVDDSCLAHENTGNTCESALAPVSIPVSIDNIDTSTSAHDEEAGSSLAPDIHDSALAPDNVDDSCLAHENTGNTCESALAPVSIPVSIDNIDTSTSAHDEEAGSSLAPDIHDSALAPDNVDDSCLAHENTGNTCESALAPVSIPVSIDNIDTSTSAHDEEAGSSLATDIHDSALAPDNVDDSCLAHENTGNTCESALAPVSIPVSIDNIDTSTSAHDEEAGSSLATDIHDSALAPDNVDDSCLAHENTGNTCESALAPVSIPVSIDNIDTSTSAHDEEAGSSLATDIHDSALAPDNVDDPCLALENTGNTCEAALAPVGAYMENIYDTEIETDDSLCDPHYKISDSADSSDDSSVSHVYPAMFEETDDMVNPVNSDFDEENPDTAVDTALAENLTAESPDTAAESPYSRQLSNDDIQRCVKCPKIYTKRFIKSSNEKSKSGRNYDTVHSCFYCRKLMSNIQTHLVNKHCNEDDVLQVKGLQKREKMVQTEQDKEKVRSLIKKKQTLLRNKGDDRHNNNVCKMKEGELLIARRRTGDFNSLLYGGCPGCLEWMVLKENYTKHKTHCPAEGKTSMSSAVLQSMIFKGQIGSNASPQLNEVFKSMKKDDISMIALKDTLIIALGEMHFFSSYGNKLKRNNYASFRMRLGARLLKLLREEIGDEECSMSDCMIVENFDRFAKCALLACGRNNDEELEHPSVALKLSDDVSKMVAAKIAYASKSRNKVDLEEGQLFASVLAREWKLKVKKQATLLLQERQFNKNTALPHPEDIANLANYLINSLNSLTFDGNIETYRRVVLLTEARLLLYNRRRPGELSALDIETYMRRSTSVNETDLSLRDELTPLEQNLLKSQELLEMRGKCHNKIPLLLPEEVKRPLAYLTDRKVRDAVGIQKDMKFVFASTGGEPVRAGTALDVVKYEANLKFPERILATNLRKHTATISQVMGLKDNELQWITNHLGHTEKIHLQHYRATSGLIERLDIAKIMLLQEKSIVGRFAGLQLKDINFEDIDAAEMTTGDEMMGSIGAEADAGRIDEDMVMDPESPPRKTRKKSTRVTWTTQEINEIEEYFKDYLDLKMSKSCPGQKECLRAIALSKSSGGILARRHWETVKKKVSNMVQKRKTETG